MYDQSWNLQAELNGIFFILEALFDIGLTLSVLVDPSTWSTLHCKDGVIFVDGRWVVGTEEGKYSKRKLLDLLIISQSYIFTFGIFGGGGVCLVVSTHGRAKVYEKLLYQILLHGICSSIWVQEICPKPREIQPRIPLCAKTEQFGARPFSPD